MMSSRAPNFAWNFWFVNHSRSTQLTSLSCTGVKSLYSLGAIKYFSLQIPHSIKCIFLAGTIIRLPANMNFLYSKTKALAMI